MKKDANRDDARLKRFDALLKWVAGDMPEAEARSFEAVLDTPGNEILKTLHEVNEATRRYLQDPAGREADQSPRVHGIVKRQRQGDDGRGEGRS